MGELEAARVSPLYLPISPLYLPVSPLYLPISPLHLQVYAGSARRVYLPYISPISPYISLTRCDALEHAALTSLYLPISPLYLPYISPISP